MKVKWKWLKESLKIIVGVSNFVIEFYLFFIDGGEALLLLRVSLHVAIACRCRNYKINTLTLCKITFISIKYSKHILNKRLLVTFANSICCISNIGFVIKLRARLVVVWAELDIHFVVAHEVGLYFLCILILGLDLNWWNVRLWELAIHYIDLLFLWSFTLLRQQRLNLRFRGQAHFFFIR